MEEALYPSSRNSLATVSPLDYNSDSELNAHDTLRMEESEDEEESKASEKEPESVVEVEGTNSCNSNETNSHEPRMVDSKSDEDTKPETTKDAIVKEPEKHLSIDIAVEVEGTNSLNFNEKNPQVSRIIDSESDEDAPTTRRIIKLKKSKLIDSDSDEKDTTEINQPVSDFEKNSLANVNLEIDETGAMINQSMSRLKSLIDSESSSPEEAKQQNVSPIKGKSRKKKLKSKKHRDACRKPKNSNDLLASLNLDFSDDEDTAKPRSGSNSSDDSDSLSDSKEDVSRRKNNQSPQNKPQRMSAKTAMEQMRVIQSESQRMARETIVSVPYHRPKQHTLQEFLSRRTIQRSIHAGNTNNTKHKTTAAAIRMTREELEVFAKQLEEREKEAIEFYKSETPEEAENIIEGNMEMLPNPVPVEETTNELATADQKNPASLSVRTDSEHTPNSAINLDTEPIGTLRVSDTEDDEVDALVNKTCENAEKMLASQIDSKIPEAGNDSKQTIDYEIFSDQNQSKLAQRKAELLAADTSIPLFPTLRGDAGMEIDLESGDLLPKTPTGVSILFERFAKCAGGKKASKATSTVNILSTDNGALKMDFISMPINLDDRDPNGKEPVPGAAFLKLKQTLREKIVQIRRETMLKRQEEMQKCKKLDEDDEADDEEKAFEDPDESELEGEEDEETTEIAADEEDPNDEERLMNSLIDEEAEDNDNDVDGEIEDAREDDESSESSSSSEDETATETTTVDEKKKSRILVAFEDSEDEDVKDSNQASEMTELNKIDTEELFSALEDSDKFTASDRKNLESGGTMALLWKDTDDPGSVSQTDDDLAALCSGRFGETQAPTVNATQDTRSLINSLPAFDNGTQSEQFEENKLMGDSLFTQRSEQVVDESELEALCSGTFTTQDQPVNLKQHPQEPQSELVSNVITKGKLVIASSDEEQTINDSPKTTKRKRKHRNNISDDDNDETSKKEMLEKEEDEEEVVEEEDEEEKAECFVDYDSEENEVEVVMTKTDKLKAANAFLENEAELSESEWGSADEDEKDLDRYDIDLADTENFDQAKLQEELERIHARRMLEQDKKEVKVLQDMFFEDEENDGVGRERQFRWRNVETTFNLDYDKKQPDEENADEDGACNNEEEEIQWRKLRHEREMLLKDKQQDLEEVTFTTTLLDKSIDEEKNCSVSTTNITLLGSKSKVTILRGKKSSEPNTPKDSPFLISKTDPVQGSKASFLCRDSATLSKLASLVKVPEIEGANTVNAGKGRNFVFAAVSPAMDKMGSKRSLELETDESSLNNKKIKTGFTKEEGVAKKRLLLGQLM
ncbi:claspin-like [Wyeomyia smithii]|uniref:claspin-like n=1 Tax=Wyeomyia smithii TaxID=174621 RepID=UPI0024680546|nr:claspin-like [Wyeomyia smithii]